MSTAGGQSKIAGTSGAPAAYSESMTWTQDLRFALRMIRKNPWFSAAIVVTLALGMGINTTVFSLVNAVLYKPLPFPGGERLVLAAADAPRRAFVDVSYADFRDFRQAARSFERLECFAGESTTLGERGNPPQSFRGMRASAGIFEMLREKPILGRGFVEADERAGTEPVMLIGYGVWKERYGGDPGVIGRTVRANEKPAVIIGVMPEGFKFPNNEDLWMAAVPDAQLERRENRRFIMAGLLKEGSTIAEAQADLAVVAHRLQQQFPDSHKDHGVRVQTFHQVMNGGQIRLVFLLMLGAVGFVLLIACANIANMLLSRAVGRVREISIRAALGASRYRIIRQLLIESVMLAALGGVLGLALARWGIRAFGLAVENVGKPYWIDFSMNYVVFGYFAAVTVLSGIVFGIAPALQAARVDLNEALKEGARSAGGRRSGLLAGALVVFQFTLAVVLSSGAGLMMRSFLLAADEFTYLRPDTILTARLGLPSSRYPKPEDRQRFYQDAAERLRALPGANVVAFVSGTPGGGSAGWRFEIEGRTIAEPERRPAAAGVIASPDYFRLLGVAVVRGRDFDANDGLPGKEAAIISQEFAARHFPNQDALGKRVRTYGPNNQARPWMTIVGIVPGFRQNDPGNPNNDSQLFVPHRFDSVGGMTLMIRTQASPAQLATAARSEIQRMDEDLALVRIETLEEQFQRSRWQWRVFGTLFAIFALVALGMAALGIYAVVAHAMNRRTQEIGVRMALGAEFGDIMRLALRRGLLQLGLGMVLGVGAALGVCRLMAGLLFRVSPNDPWVLGSVAATLAAAGLLACCVPARRAARLDPVKALRYE
jgi:putative ABC transport system permease protein